MSQNFRKSKSIVPTKKIFYDPLEWYKTYHKELEENRNQMSDLNGECYISFSKLLKNEMKRFEHKDSKIFSCTHSLSMSRKLS